MSQPVHPDLSPLNLFHSANYRGLEHLQDQDSSLYMRSCGIERCLPGYTFPESVRTGWHLHLVLDGKGRFQAGGKSYELHEGQFFLIKPGEETHYQADERDPWHYCWVTYDGANAGHYMAYAGFGDGVNVQECRADVMEMLNLVKEIVSHPELNHAAELYRMSLALRFLSLAVASYEQGIDPEERRKDLTTDEYVDYAVKYIRSNFATIRISDVANYIGINRTYFSTVFKKKMLMSPQEYLMQVRMSRSRDLLLHTDLPIYMVAKEVGYDDQLAFSKVFKKKYGLSPEQYRKKHNEEHPDS